MLHIESPILNLKNFQQDLLNYKYLKKIIPIKQQPPKIAIILY